MAKMTKTGCVFYFNNLHIVKKNYQILLSKTKGWPFDRNGALSLFGPPKDDFSGKLTFVNDL